VSARDDTAVAALGPERIVCCRVRRVRRY